MKRSAIVDLSGDDARHWINAQARRQIIGGIRQRIIIDIIERNRHIEWRDCLVVDTGLITDRPDQSRFDHRPDLDRDRREVGAALTIRNRIIERIVADKTGIRRIRDRTIRVDRHGTIGRSRRRDN